MGLCGPPKGNAPPLCSLPLLQCGYSPFPRGLSSAPLSLAPWGEPQILLGHCCPWRFAQARQEQDPRGGLGEPQPCGHGPRMNWLHPHSDSEQSTAGKEHRAHPALGQSCPNPQSALPSAAGWVWELGVQNRAEGARMDWGLSWPEEPRHREPVSAPSPFPVLREGHWEPEQRLGLSLMCQ